MSQQKHEEKKKAIKSSYREIPQQIHQLEHATKDVFGFPTERQIPQCITGSYSLIVIVSVLQQLVENLLS